MIKDDKKIEEPVKFKGKFISAIGKRKTSAAQIRLYKNGSGIIIVNGMKTNKYFTNSQSAKIMQVLKLSGHTKDLDFSIAVKGGGKKAQGDAVCLGISRALVESNAELKPSLKAKGWLTRDSRKKERKKPGLKKARRAPQWAKR